MNENKRKDIKLSSKAENILSKIDDKTKIGYLRKIAMEIKKIINYPSDFGRQESFCRDYLQS